MSFQSRNYNNIGEGIPYSKFPMTNEERAEMMGTLRDYEGDNNEEFCKLAYSGIPHLFNYF